VQLAKAAGARVFATVSNDAKAGLVKDNGADTVINYAKEKFADEVLRLTDGRGVDLVLDAVGKPTFEEGIRCLAPFGHLILYGRSGGAPDPLNVFTLFPKSQKVSGFMLPSVTRGFPTRCARAPTAALPSCATADSRSTSQDVPAGSGGRGASLPRIEAVDRKADPDPVKGSLPERPPRSP